MEEGSIMVGEAQQQEARAESQTEVERGHRLSKFVPSDVIPATKLHPLKVPQPSQTWPPVRDQVF